MIITFCGHKDYCSKEEDERRILEFLEEKVGDQPVEFYLGGYGRFDYFAHECCDKYKAKHPNAKTILVTPYITVEYQKNRLKLMDKFYDEIVYPNIEDKPLRFAIVYRNRYMVDKADYVIARVDFGWGGAYTTYQYAKRKHKEIFNLGQKV